MNQKDKTREQKKHRVQLLDLAKRILRIVLLSSIVLLRSSQCECSFDNQRSGIQDVDRTKLQRISKDDVARRKFYNVKHPSRTR